MAEIRTLREPRPSLSSIVRHHYYRMAVGSPTSCGVVKVCPLCGRKGAHLVQEAPGRQWHEVVHTFVEEYHTDDDMTWHKETKVFCEYDYVGRAAEQKRTCRVTWHRRGK